MFNQLDKAYCDLCTGDAKKAIHKLEAFRSIVTSKVTDGRIDPEKGQSLIEGPRAAESRSS